MRPHTATARNERDEKEIREVVGRKRFARTYGQWAVSEMEAAGTIGAKCPAGFPPALWETARKLRWHDWLEPSEVVYRLDEFVRRKRQAKTRARRIGLRYWPALLWEEEIDPRAYVWAEKFLARKHGFYGEPQPGGRRSRGGWDFQGHYGVSPAFVADAWRNAGCRPSKKFFYQLRGEILPKSVRVTQAAAYRRGFRWVNKLGCGDYPSGLMFTTKAFIALGRISPLARRAALMLEPWVRARSPARVTVNSLNWGLVHRLRSMSDEEKARVETLPLDADAAWVQLLGGCPGGRWKGWHPCAVGVSVEAIKVFIAHNRLMRKGLDAPEGALCQGDVDTAIELARVVGGAKEALDFCAHWFADRPLPMIPPEFVSPSAVAS